MKCLICSVDDLWRVDTSIDFAFFGGSREGIVEEEQAARS